MGLLRKIFGSHSDRELKKIKPLADRVEAMETKYKNMTEAELKGMTAKLKARLAKGETLDDILPEAFATVREAADRVLGMRPFRVQIIGGIVLHQGRIAEMKTGEGKTLVATMPAYLNALTGEGVHIVTVNEYLARRDSEWMGKVYRYLGLSVGLIIHDIPAPERKAAYAADITYGTNNEFGFDYLRDNMAIYKDGMVQRGHSFAIVDEVDSILIDEARTPLIISGQGDKSTELYTLADKFAARLKATRVRQTDDKQEYEDQADGDYIVDEKARSVTLTADGIAKAEKAFNLENLSDPDNATLSHHINQAIRARGLMRRDVDYVVKDGEVIIVDEHTGHLMFGRRYSEGLHQAIEAKEGVKVERESKTLATITFQNFFRLYGKLSGMTGTALTEEEEFRQIYNLDVIEIPTNKPLLREDIPDIFYKTEAGKFRAVIQQIIACNEQGQPVLVGTISIEKSEQLSALLKKQGVKHNVLNAKYHEKEAEIVAQAGKFGAVTIATNMAGRGTDIKLGGNAEYMANNDMRKAGLSEELINDATSFAETDNPEILEAREKYAEFLKKHERDVEAEAAKVIAAGGLYILGTERHESRRIDNQLRGRADRQGDPGKSRFFISMEDDLMRLFGSERILGMMESLGIDEDTPIDQKMLTGAIESAQKKVESRHFQTRKSVLQFDDVMNQQRGIIYDQRGKVLNGEDLKPAILAMVKEAVERSVQRVVGDVPHPDAVQLEEILTPYEGVFIRKGEIRYSEDERSTLTAEALVDKLQDAALSAYEVRERELTPALMRELERVILLRVVDSKWMDHIDAMQELRQGIYLRAYGQQDPIVEYKREGFDMFEEMIGAIRDDTVRLVFTARVQNGAPERQQVAKPTLATHGDGTDTRKRTVVRKTKKVGRNDPCPCGSGLKYKKCCGRNDGAADGDNA
ncbi:preprotein translocase subunit SecA [Oscillospiraceae bacterium OttesenSCG-928-F05]|nr:preprotein translocase subunit SecA [Oscillospiraceae bacterium OttesenSCG-928-F05]